MSFGLWLESIKRMIPGCPNLQCQFHERKDRIIRKGSYYRKDDSRKIARFLCKECGRKFSTATFKMEYKQKKRRINNELFKLLASGMSMRRSARHLRVHHKTIHRKVIYLAKKARKTNADFLQMLRKNPVAYLQFDDLITSVHTKLKPAAVSIVIDAENKFILGFEVGSIPAFGHLAEISRKKYGRRKNEHEEKLNSLFERICESVSPEAKIESDEHRSYAPIIEKFFPQAIYRQYKGSKGCVVGQGELKKIKYDPLFPINHTCAMLRADINRLFRRTWCTSKNMDMLRNHIEIYVAYRNYQLQK